MRQIEGLDQKLTHFDDAADAPIKDGLPTFRRCYINGLVSAQAKDGEEALELYRIGNRIREAKDSVRLEDADFKILEGKIRANAPAWLAHYHAQLLLKLKTSAEVPA